MQPQFTRNPYRTDEQNAYIALLDRQRQLVAEAIIDLADLDLVLNFGRWHARFTSPGTRPYVGTHHQGGTVLLHRLLLSPPEGMVGDHSNRDPLDNRRANLRICTKQENDNRKSVHVRYIAGERRHTLEEAVALYKQIHRLDNNHLDTELARLRHHA